MKIYLRVSFIFIRIILIFIPIILFMYLLYKDFVVSGKLSARYDFNRRSPIITVLRPQGRISEIQYRDGRYLQQIKEQPVYFDVRLPQRFDTARVAVQLQNIDQPVVELGAMGDKDRWVFDLKPIDNLEVNSLFNDKLRWNMIEENGLYLFQKDLRYKSVSDFIHQPPSLEKIAVFNYRFPYTFLMPAYKKSSEKLKIEKSLRGTHRFYTYVKDEDLDFRFIFQDLNRHVGEDHISLEVYFGNENIYSDFLAVDNNESDNVQMSDAAETKLFLSNLLEGVYRIELISPSDDIVIRSIETRQQLISFIDQIYLSDNVGYENTISQFRRSPTLVYTDGHIITAETMHNEGLQLLKVGDKELIVEKTHIPYSVEASFGLKSVVILENDIRLNTKGLWSFSQNSFFNPDITSLADGRDFDKESIDYVVTRYTPPTLQGKWKVGTVEYDVKKLYTNDNMLHFVISLPYMKDQDTGVYISDISVELEKKPLEWNDIYNKFNKLIHAWQE